MKTVEYYRKWRAEHPEKVAEYSRAYRERHPQRIKDRWTAQNNSPKWKAYKKEHYKKYKTIQQPIAAARRKVVRNIIDTHKSVPCMDCGKKYPPYVMDFDHVRGIKIIEIGRMLNQTRPDKVLEEIDKCEVVCSNCHRERTYQRKQNENDSRKN